MAQNLTFAWASPSGQPGLTWGSLIIQDSALGTPTQVGGCYIRVVTNAATQMADDSGTLGTLPNVYPGQPWSANAANSHCSLNGPASVAESVTNGTSNMSVTLNLKFLPAWSGKTLSIWMQGTNANYQSGTWQQLGTFAVQ